MTLRRRITGAVPDIGADEFMATPTPDLKVDGSDGPITLDQSDTITIIVEVLNMPVSGLPAGTYTLYFGVDTLMDGNVTWDSVYYDTVVVNITE